MSAFSKGFFSLGRNTFPLRSQMMRLRLAMNLFRQPYHSYKGQALLMVVVAMVIVLTISLSVATRSVVNLQTTNEEAKSSAAFSAAEAGIEKYLQAPTPYIGQFGTSNITVDTKPVGGSSQFVVNNGNPVLKDDGVDVWLSTYPTYASPWTGTLNVYWGTTNDCATAAIEYLLISGPSVAASTITRQTFDPCALRQSSDHFTSSTTTSTLISGITYKNVVSIPVTSGYIVRIIPLFANTYIAVSGGTNLPQQGTVVSSTGKSGTAVRKITIYQGYPKVPSEFFQYTLFSP